MITKVELVADFEHCLRNLTTHALTQRNLEPLATSQCVFTSPSTRWKFSTTEQNSFNDALPDNGSGDGDDAEASVSFRFRRPGTSGDTRRRRDAERDDADHLQVLPRSAVVSPWSIFRWWPFHQSNPGKPKSLFELVLCQDNLLCSIYYVRTTERLKISRSHHWVLVRMVAGRKKVNQKVEKVGRNL